MTLDCGKYVEPKAGETSWMGGEGCPSVSKIGGIRSTGDGVSVLGWSQPFKLAAARSSLAITRSWSLAMRSRILRPANFR